MNRYLALTCEALARSTYAIAATTPHTVSVQLFEQGLHNTPKVLRASLQAQIDAVPPGEYDAILLLYGMCGTSTIGLAARQLPLVIPRAHDCITLYLGSRERYDAEFNAHPGTYWYSLDYMERNRDANASGLGAMNLGEMDEVYAEYVEKYGQDNADYLMEVMGEWGKHYDRAVFIDMDTGDGMRFEQMAQQQAERRNWLFERKQGNRRLLEMVLNGEWPDDEVLVVPPGHAIRQRAGDGLIAAEPLDEPRD
ncbi:DUF1638 domain-containing protein [Aggregatilinea lenta]|uniref:DUF1638 domain-containing protein n=1 Tax=Aggregatilinea lenta TaxID=913108 RepID=UPI000E5BAFB2|nr:DUF1638 domain-containing protein [Aggregatilinea lenta]